MVAGRLAAGEDDAVAALAELGGPVALKRSAGLLHKTAPARWRSTSPPSPRCATRAASPRRRRLLVERMAEPGAELLVAVRRDGVVPALVVGLGGVHAEVLDDVAVVPLPADARPRRGRAAQPARRAAARRRRPRRRRRAGGRARARSSASS